MGKATGPRGTGHSEFAHRFVAIHFPEGMVVQRQRRWHFVQSERVRRACRFATLRQSSRWIAAAHIGDLPSWYVWQSDPMRL